MKKVVSLLLLLAVIFSFAGCVQVQKPPSSSSSSQSSSSSSQSSSSSSQSSSSSAWEEVFSPEQQSAEEFLLTFAGDCTMGDNYDDEGGWGSYTRVVGKNYGYPFSNIIDYFRNDDYTLVNLECALTAADPTEEEMEELKDHRFRFRGPMDYAKILSQNSVEFASCANNHSKDYGKQGLYDTWQALKDEQVDFASFSRPCVVETERGLKIGIFAIFFEVGKAGVESAVKSLRQQGAELIIMSIHWGDEGGYRPIEYQVNLGRMAIDAGVDIVYGHHSHTLMPVESYHGGVIFYSLGNFTFGGNKNPTDKDTAILQQQILRFPDGTVTLGELTVIPCRVSTSEDWNDYRPTPYEKEDPAYKRVIAKLEGSYDEKGNRYE